MIQISADTKKVIDAFVERLKIEKETAKSPSAYKVEVYDKKDGSLVASFDNVELANCCFV